MYYPVCRGAPPWPSTVTGLMLLGAMDDIAPPALCNPVSKGVPAETLRVIAYPDARHGFDMRGFPKDASAGGPAYNAAAAEASWKVVTEFLK